MSTLFVRLQYLLPQHLLTRLMGKLGECRISWFKNAMIKLFIRRYQVDMSAAQIENPENYASFNEFFTRTLKSQLRPIVQLPNQIACPADGCISQIGKIEQQNLFQAKGFYFTLKNLLGGNENYAAPFLNGQFATIYLAPRDYHRVHMPFSGKLRETIFIPGQLFSVNKITAASVPNLFARNERLVCLFDTEIGPMAVILVGAMIVGSIGTVWDEHPSTKDISYKTFSNVYLNKGDELGHFKMGSTVILLFGENSLAWDSMLHAESIVQMGQLLGTIHR